jgi:hypothetical protein
MLSVPEEEKNYLQFCETYSFKKRVQATNFSISSLLLLLDPG